MPHGRSEEDWRSMMEAARVLMVHTARRQELITYSELNCQMAEDADVAPFDFALPPERNALGTLLADIVKADVLHSRFLLSSVATLSDLERGPGSGFYALAESLEALEPGASSERRFEFWAKQVELTHDHYKRRI